MIDISNKIKNLRKEMGLKQKEVANALHIATNTLSQFENNNGRPSIDVLSSMADFFGVSVDYLIGREDDFGNVTIKGKEKDLSEEEQNLLSYFSRLSPFERQTILKQIKALSSETK